MKTLRQAHDRLIATMARATAITSDHRYVVAQLRGAAWQQYRTLEQQAENERDPIALDALIDQMDRLLDDVAAVKEAQP